MKDTLLTNAVDRRKKIADALFYAGLLMLVTGMPLSMFLMSVSQFVILGGWIIGGSIIQKLKRVFSNKVCMALFAFYAMHILGLFYTTDFNYALRDLRIKLPLLLLPLLFFTGPSLTKKQFILLLKLFVATCLVSSLISTAVWLQIIQKPVNDIRDISIFISHIRLSLLIAVAIFISGYFATSQEEKPPVRIAAMLLIAWFIIFLSILQSLTGLAAVAVTSVALIMKHMISQRKYIPLLLTFSLIAAVCVYSAMYFKTQIQLLRKEALIDLSNLPLTTSRGNAYTHETTNGDVENGHRIYMFVCYTELDSAWKLRSTMPYDGLDKRNQHLKYTLIRYMTSKGLYKDADGLAALSDADIQNIENGIGSILELENKGLKGRIYTTIWELNNYLLGGDFNGHTMAMRFEFWKASVNIIKSNLLIGVGTGDNQLELNSYYQTHQTRLSEQWWLRSHNQFLAIGVSFGITGVAIFLFALFYPVVRLRKSTAYFYFCFFIIALLSFFTEDTLETQAGVTFFGFFNTFFLAYHPDE